MDHVCKSAELEKLKIVSEVNEMLDYVSHVRIIMFTVL